MYNEQEFIDKIFECKNIVEVRNFIDSDRFSIIAKQFNEEIVILRVFDLGTNDVSIKHLYFNLITKEYEIDHQCGHFVNDLENNLIKVVRKGEYFYFVFTNGTIEMNVFYYPPGDHYKIKIDDGFSGGGSGWSKKGLGLE